MFNDNPGGGPDHAAALGILARARPDRLKALAEKILEAEDGINVISNRTGLVMVPIRDTVRNVDFHLGEVLVSEAHIVDAAGMVGYGMVTGRDLERAMAMAVVDLRLVSAGHDPGIAAFLSSEGEFLSLQDDQRMRQVEATRVEMETF